MNNNDNDVILQDRILYLENVSSELTECIRESNNEIDDLKDKLSLSSELLKIALMNIGILKIVENNLDITEPPLGALN